MTRCALAVRPPASLHSLKVSSRHLHTASGTVAQQEGKFGMSIEGALEFSVQSKQSKL